MPPPLMPAEVAAPSDAAPPPPCGHDAGGPPMNCENRPALTPLAQAGAGDMGWVASEPANAAAAGLRLGAVALSLRSEEHTSELQSLMRISYAVFCLKKKKSITTQT